jgi:hypothetical protein
MSDDLFAQMTRALADEHDGATAVPEVTRARIIRALAERKPRRRKWFVVGVPAFLIFGGSTAWAAVAGKLPTVVEQALTVVTFGVVEFDEEPEARIRTRVFKRQAASPQEKKQSELAPTSVAETKAEPMEAPEGPPIVEPASPLPMKKRAPALDPALNTYQMAHRAQFRGGDCSAAAQGYEEYLSVAPGGSFAVDARYNRAVCLIKLGRTVEARSALKPFADGRYGAHRQKRAGELLSALE